MKKSLVWLVIFISNIVTFAQNGNESYRILGYDYISPLPGSSLISAENNIIVRYKDQLTLQKIQMNFITLSGSESGNHEGNLVLSDDDKTLIFLPSAHYELGETLSVKLNNGSFSLDGTPLKEFSFQFIVSKNGIAKKIFNLKNFLKHEKISSKNSLVKERNIINKDSLIDDFPDIDVSISNNPSRENYFIGPFNILDQPVYYLGIIDNKGIPIFYRKMPGPSSDFKVQSTGILTYYDAYNLKFYAMDSSYALIDSFMCGNGYGTDIHELNILPSAHAFLMSYDHQIIRMDTIVQGGNPNVDVVGLIIQELDKNRNVVFQWRSWDYYKITDAADDIDLTAANIDYVHGNAIEVDHDGNLLISSRHMDEVTKINRTTGDIIWRLGGKNNQFRFINDTYGFSHQHDVREVPNGDLTLFDNGNLHSPPFSRAVEYKIDDTLKTARLVWQYRHDPDYYSFAMGSNRLLSNGNRIIGWGAKGENSSDITEVTPDDQIVFEASFPDTIYSYRVFKFPWRTNLFSLSSYNIGFGKVNVGDSASLIVIIKNNSKKDLNITGFFNRDPAFIVDNHVPFSIHPSEEIPLKIKYKPLTDKIDNDILYIKSEKTGERIAEAVNLAGGIVLSVKNKNQVLEYELSQNYPNPFNPVTTISYSIPKTSFVTLKVYDVLGREAAVLVNQEKPAGKYKTQFNGNGLASGIYFYKLTASPVDGLSSKFSQVKKIILLK